MAGRRSPAALLLLMILSACGGSPKLAPVEERTTSGSAAGDPVDRGSAAPPQAVARPLPEPGTASAPADPSATTAPRGVQSTSPAVVALLNDANRASGDGRHDQAAASIERAIAIEPQSAWLWHRLAAIRLEQGELGQAAALAAKSNSLAVEDRRLQADNWRLIAEVHRRRGEHTAARSAADKAARLAPP
ncbi:MAG: hypothetical protein R3174_04115 [Gammaproteobacteria bacterium]|nr:hypothetical protein [Gammaproteobacteria bacterium]